MSITLEGLRSRCSTRCAWTSDGTVGWDGVEGPFFLESSTKRTFSVLVFAVFKKPKSQLLSGFWTSQSVFQPAETYFREKNKLVPLGLSRANSPPPKKDMLFNYYSTFLPEKVVYGCRRGLFSSLLEWPKNQLKLKFSQAPLETTLWKLITDGCWVTWATALDGEYSSLQWQPQPWCKKRSGEQMFDDLP